MKNLIRLIRPKQWLKNIFVLLPVFFSGMLFKTDSLLPSLIAFLAFCFAASAIYCLNDMVDADDDRRHPVKCNRPVASGEVSYRTATIILAASVVLSALCISLLRQRMLQVGLIIAVYTTLNVLYCIWLKRHAIIDVCIIASGFVLRVLAGGMAADVIVSKWLVLMTFLLTLFMSFAKRRDDVLRMNETGEVPRKNTIRYNLTFINGAITITASVTLVCYIMYTVSTEIVSHFNTDYLYLTSIFVLVGLLRYIQLTVVDKKSGDPTKIMIQDRFMQAIALLWALSIAVIIYVL